MKKTDIAMIVLIASISVIAAFFATSAVFEGISSENATVKTVEAITSEVTPPDPAIFNTEAINPTVEVQVGSGDN